MQLDILIVDDEPLLASLLKEMFQRSGHEVHIVDNVASALTSLQQFSFDGVICDVNLPDGRGDMIIESSIKNTNTVHPKFYLMSGYFPDDILETVKENVTAFFKKPSDLSKIVSEVEKSFVDELGCL